MRDDDSFLAFVRDALRPWGSVSVRRMFGAAGLFRDGTMFGFVLDDALYLKVGAANRAAFIEAGCKPFVYTAKGKAMAMSYWDAPAAALDDEEMLRAIVAGAWAVARAGAARGSSGRKPRPRPKAKRNRQAARDSGGN
ncbi:MAG: TfoX/Sxy family protein [Alphaproteobacteria bacterium]|nr:TfoX/Sxy family protein [Alphaproteobacteria bacterium]